MAARVARHGARRRTAGAANALEAFAVAGGALSVVALMTVLAGGPGRVDGAVTGEESDPGSSQVVSPTSIGSGSGTPGPTIWPVATGHPSSGVSPHAPTAVPLGPPTTLPVGPPSTTPPRGLGPPSPRPVGTTAPGDAPTTNSDTPRPPSTWPSPTTPSTKPKPVPSSRPVTPGVPPTDAPRATPKG